jgi:AhpD family alkylhydroperoxidase
MVNSEQGLATYFALTTAKSPLQAKEKEVINLVVSQVNTCDYCLAAHTVLSKMNGFNDEQVVTNYLYSMSDIKLDFPAAPVLDAQTA